ncbi:MAG: PilX N-terminal domain-containing pilus assembly protein [Gallionella sp.]|nr:PilX N-terminal domain-containing pilus assembly protein [Gallionella sp.]
MMRTKIHFTPRQPAQRGASLIMVMLILVVVSLLGVGGAQIALMSERGARNDRDQQVAWQAAEAALTDADFEMSYATSGRVATFDGKNQSAFVAGCGTTGGAVGLCALNLTGKPAWLTVDYTDTSASAPTTKFGTFTSRVFAYGNVGIQPAKAPRYVIEMVTDPSSDPSDPTYLYRVTAMGFGPRDDIQAVLQMIYRI